MEQETNYIKLENVNGKGIIRLRHRDEFDLQSFYVNKEAIALDMHDGGGTMGRYFFLTHSPKQHIEIEAINKALNSGEISNLAELNHILPVIIELFENGFYCIALNDFAQMFQYYVLMHTDYNNYYPPESLICFTQSEDTINYKRVEHYKQMIESGKRPIVMLTSATYTEEIQYMETHNFIVDGHHKMLAYNQLKIVPKVLWITRQLTGLHEIELENFNEDEKAFNHLHALLKKKSPW